MTRRIVLAVAAVAGAAALACRAIPAPPDGVLSLSQVIFPAPGVLAGDTLRDSLGRAAPLRIVAYGTGGEEDTITRITPVFTTLDPGVHITKDGYVIGDSVRITPVRIVGTVGTLQTSTGTLAVIPHPDTVTATTTRLAAVSYSIYDSTSSSNVSGPMTINVSNRALAPTGNGGVQAVSVRYAIAYQPATIDGSLAAVLQKSTVRSVADTTDGSGNASHTVRIRAPKLASSAPDSVVVLVTARFAGTEIPGSPIRFVVPIQAPATKSGNRGQ